VQKVYTAYRTIFNVVQIVGANAKTLKSTGFWLEKVEKAPHIVVYC
jgi:hypothetical protein